jgi:hypothetical protein
LPAKSALIDGEAVAFLPGGHSDFAALRTKSESAASARGGPKAAPLAYHPGVPNEHRGFGSELLPFAAVPISTAGVLPPGVVGAVIPPPVIRMNHNVRT